MQATELLASGIPGLGMEAFRLLATLITGFAVLLGTALFACGMVLTVVELVGWARDAGKAADPQSMPGRAQTRR